MRTAPVFVSMVFVYDSESYGPELHLASREPVRTLTPRERTDRLYALGEFRAAAELLLRESVN